MFGTGFSVGGTDFSTISLQICEWCRTSDNVQQQCRKKHSCWLGCTLYTHPMVPLLKTAFFFPFLCSLFVPALSIVCSGVVDGNLNIQQCSDEQVTLVIIWRKLSKWFLVYSTFQAVSSVKYTHWPFSSWKKKENSLHWKNNLASNNIFLNIY